MKWEEAFERVKANRSRVCELLAMAWLALAHSRNADLQATLTDRSPTAVVMCRTLDSFGVPVPRELAEHILGDIDPAGGTPSIH